MKRTIGSLRSYLTFRSISVSSLSFFVFIFLTIVMQLPVKNEQPDYELMSTLISAIQKLVIADVVKFSDEKIKATKQVVG